MKVKKISMMNIGLVPDGHYNVDSRNIFVIGRNQSGKSTFVQSLGMLIDGSLKDYARIGEDKSSMSYEFDDGTTLNWSVTKGSEKIQLIQNGKSKTNPTRKMLREVFGKGFDVNAFIRLSPLQRKKEIAEMSDIPLDEYTDKVKKAEDERKVANAQYKTQKAKVGHFVPHKNPPVKTDTKALIQERDTLRTQQEQFDNLTRLFEKNELLSEMHKIDQSEMY